MISTIKMIELKTEFEKNIVAKVSTIKNIMKENACLLQSINTLFIFNQEKSIKLIKHGHSLLCTVRLLKNSGDNCIKCRKDWKLTKKNKGDRLV